MCGSEEKSDYNLRVNLKKNRPVTVMRSRSARKHKNLRRSPAPTLYKQQKNKPNPARGFENLHFIFILRRSHFALREHLDDVTSRARQVDHPGSATTPSVNVLFSALPVVEWKYFYLLFQLSLSYNNIFPVKDDKYKIIFSPN